MISKPFTFLLLSSLLINLSYADSTGLGPGIYDRPKSGPKLLYIVQDVYATYIGNTVFIPATCPTGSNPTPTCSLINTDYDFCNISKVQLDYNLQGTSGGYDLRVVGNASSSGWGCNKGTDGFRGIHATCKVYCA